MANRCNKTPVLRMHWPGEGWKNVCQDHARWADTIGRELGFQLTITNDASPLASCEQMVDPNTRPLAEIPDPNVCGQKTDQYVFSGHLGADEWFPLCALHMSRAERIAKSMKWPLYRCGIEPQGGKFDRCQFTLSKREVADRIGRALVQPDPDAQVKP